MSLSQPTRPDKNRSGFSISAFDPPVTPPETLETERLALRMPAMDDADEIFSSYARDPEVTKYLLWTPHRNIQTTRKFLRECLSTWKKGTSFQWAIIRKEDKKLLGMVSCRPEEGHKAQLGYVLARSEWGKGYATEAVRALVDWAVSQDGIHRVWAACDVDNKASARVLEKVGMVREGTLRRWSIHPALSPKPRDSYCYAKTK